jgi:hypothetical protein
MFLFDEMREISWPAAELVASEDSAPWSHLTVWHSVEHRLAVCRETNRAYSEFAWVWKKKFFELPFKRRVFKLVCLLPASIIFWNHIICNHLQRSRYSDYATGWTVRGSNSGRGEIFRSRPDRPWGPPSLLYNGYRISFPGGKAAGVWSWPLTPI